MVARSGASAEREPVIRISLPYVYNLAESLEPLLTLQADSRYMDIFITLWSAHTQIDGLINNSVFTHTLRSSRAHADALQRAIKVETENPNSDRVLTVYDVVPIIQQATQFKTALLAELGVLPSYFVTQKEGFETFTLLDWGERLFPSDLKDKVPDGIFDVNQAGKALAFELPTAAGFHLFRATERSQEISRARYRRESSPKGTKHSDLR
jgi:hypothetical protein